MASGWNNRLKSYKPTSRRSRLRQRNPERQARVQERKWGPEAWRIILWASQCYTCQRGREVDKRFWDDLDYLQQRPPQSEISHTTGRKMGAEPAVPAVGHTIPQCGICHDEIHNAGWQGCREFAQRAAEALAWTAWDHGVLDVEPDCRRPKADLESCLIDLRHAWARRKEE